MRFLVVFLFIGSIYADNFKFESVSEAMLWEAKVKNAQIKAKQDLAEGARKLLEESKVKKISSELIEKKKFSADVSYKNESISSQKIVYGSMKKPVKTIVVDVYQEVEVDTEVERKIMLDIKALLEQLHKVKTDVKPKLEVKIRE